MYTLRFPFQLPANKKIGSAPATSTLAGLTLSLEEGDCGFPTEDDAKDYIKRAWAGLMWILLNRGLSPQVNLCPREVQFGKDHLNPGNVNLAAWVDGAAPAVYQTNIEEQIRTFSGGPVHVLESNHASQVLKLFCEGAFFADSDKVVSDDKLRIALELYGAYFTESSQNARFLTLVMSLEALATGIPRTKLVIDLLDKWKQEVAELKKTVTPSSDDGQSLEAVSQELLFRTEDSIRRQVKRVVFDMLRSNGDQDAEEVSKLALKVYAHRSALVHEGKLDQKILEEACGSAKMIVERVLKARFSTDAGIAS